MKTLAQEVIEMYEEANPVMETMKGKMYASKDGKKMYMESGKKFYEMDMDPDGKTAVSKKELDRADYDKGIKDLEGKEGDIIVKEAKKSESDDEYSDDVDKDMDDKEKEDDKEGDSDNEGKK